MAQAHPGCEGLSPRHPPTPPCHWAGQPWKLISFSLTVVCKDSVEGGVEALEGSQPTLHYLPTAWHIGRWVPMAGSPFWRQSPVFFLCVMGFLWKTKMRICPYGR